MRKKRMMRRMMRKLSQIECNITLTDCSMIRCRTEKNTLDASRRVDAITPIQDSDRYTVLYNYYSCTWPGVPFSICQWFLNQETLLNTNILGDKL